jgi:hypothetical protein
MAAFLKRQYDLVDLKISLESTGSRTDFRCILEATHEGKLRQVRQWVAPIQELHLPARMERRVSDWTDYVFPAAVLDELRLALFEELNYEGVLWIHLERPYGILGMFPWEEKLQRALNRPILRLPDFIVRPPLETPLSLDVLICASAPLAKGPFEVADVVQKLVQKIQGSVTRRTRIHLFTDMPVYAELQAHPLPQVVAYSPESAASYGMTEPTTNLPDLADRLENPWLQWMRDSLKGRSIDVAHFICHGYLSVDRGAVALAESPVRNQDSQMARFIGTSEFLTFLTQIGAWSAAFTTPHNCFSRSGLRLFVDTLAQLRPLSVIYHDLGLDPGASALAAAYRLLFSPQPEIPPSDPSLFVYCQPFRVAGQPRQVSAPASASAPSPDLEAVVQASDNLPAWLAASQRYLDQCEWKLRRIEQGEPEAASPELMMEQQGIREALRRIQSAVTTLAKKETI